MSDIATVWQDQLALGRYNYERLHRALGVKDYFQAYVTVPMYQGSLCVGFNGDEPGISYNQRANFEVAEESNAELTILVDNLHGKETGKPLKSGLIRFAGRSALHAATQQQFNGFVATVRNDGFQTLHGLQDNADLELPDVQPRDVDNFVVACTVVLEDKLTSR